MYIHVYLKYTIKIIYNYKHLITKQLQNDGNSFRRSLLLLLKFTKNRWYPENTR